MVASWIVVGGSVMALLSGLGVGFWIGQNFEWSETIESPAPAIGVEDMEPLITDAAERWATAHGRPDAAGLVADKLRTMYAISYGRPVVPPRRRWWSW